jgi:phage shock protein C
MERRLYRSRRERVIGGVAGGLGEYLGIDPVIVRALFVLLSLAGAGVLFYIILWIVVPEAPLGSEPLGIVARPYTRLDSRQQGILIGTGLIVLGGMLLLRQLHWFWWLDWGRLWPLLLVAVGVFLLWDHMRRTK